MHAYTDQVSVVAGETIRVHVSSSYPYELEICRLGIDANSVDRDEVLHSFGRSGRELATDSSRLIPARRETARSQVRAIGLDARALGQTVAHPGRAGAHQPARRKWCRRLRIVRRPGWLHRFLHGRRRRISQENLHTTTPDLLKMQINPQGLKAQADNTPSSVLQNQWHHVVACADRESKQVWVDGVLVAQWKAPGPVRPGDAPLRIGATGKEGLAGFLLDADIAMPAVYAKALSAEQIKTRFAAKALSRPVDPALLGCWPLDEERGDRAADVSPHRRDAQHHQPRNLDDRRPELPVRRAASGRV